MKKILFNSVLIMSIGACTQINPEINAIDHVHTEENGNLMIEVELPNIVQGEKSTWNVNREKDDDIFIQKNTVTPNNKTSDEALIYTIDITSPGKYRIWSRVHNDSITEGLILRIHEKIMEVNPVNLPQDQFVWVNENASFAFDTGRYQIYLQLKEKHLKVDKLLLLKDQRMEPDGLVMPSLIMQESDEIISKLIAGRENQKQLVPFNVIYGDYSLADAYALQSKLADTLNHKLGKIVGYKMAFATESAMEKFNLNEPVYGPLFENQQIENRSTVNLNDFMQFHIENEIAFITSEITEKVNSQKNLKNYIKSIHLSYDMADGRFDRSNGREGINDFVASGGGAHRFILGEAVAGNDHELANQMMRIHQNSHLIYEGNTNEAMGNPWNALLWIVNDLLGHGQTIHENMIFLTGKVDSPYTPDGIEAKGLYKGTCEGFPDVECTVK